MQITIRSTNGVSVDALLNGITATLIRDRGSLSPNGGTIRAFDGTTEVGTYLVEL